MEYCLAPGDKPKDTGPAWDDHPLVVTPVLAIGGQITAHAQSVEWLDSKARIVSFPDEGAKNRLLSPSRSYAIPEIKTEGTAWYLWVKVIYRGPFSTGHETSACWRYDMESSQFVQFGGAEYNYSK